ncbi:MAG: hypothetical protein GTO41_22965 [Burkholderiales bacterium]|nr:hypothetical protein [Burkholderiales bacterium]
MGRLTKRTRDQWRDNFDHGDFDYDERPWVADCIQLLDECDALERERDEARAQLRLMELFELENRSEES